jgi:hypothetical protein
VIEPSGKLKEMLASGWKVAGFQQITEPMFEGPERQEVALASSGGYLILLQKDSDLAVCQVSFDSMEHYVDAIHHLTEVDK